MTIYQYWRKVSVLLKSNPELRPGQAAYNTLCRCRPELAKRVQGSPMDPFYEEFKGQRYYAFKKYVERHW
jgi:hypothetical protein